ncbi:unnamed protein product [Schistosoma turkestanicum]|nr:unnamed protein product [Schistosoma turkestanicum]
MPTINSRSLNLPKIRQCPPTSRRSTRKHRQLNCQSHRSNNPRVLIKKPRTFGLYLITKTSHPYKITNFQISLSYKVLRRSPNLTRKKTNSAIHCQLLPVNYLLNDKSARTQQLPREITDDRMRALMLPSPPHLRKINHKTLTLNRNARKLWKKSPELQLMSERYRLAAKMQPKLLHQTKRYLDPKFSDRLIYNGSRLKFFYDSLYQCNFPAVKFVLEREPGLILDAVEPNTGYSILLAALLIRSPLKRVKLMRLLLKYLQKFIQLSSDRLDENEICARILQWTDPIDGRDCIGWTCLLGFEVEFKLLMTHLSAGGIDFQKSDFTGNTYLHLAIINGSVMIVNDLCQSIRKYCISMENCLNSFGLNPIQLAYHLKMDAITNILDKQ